MKILIPAILAAAVACAQGGLFRPNFSTAPANAVPFESSETLDASAVRACSSSSVVVTRTDGTHLSIGNGSSASAIQFVRFGTKTRFVTSAVTLTATAGTGSGTVQMYGQLTAAGALQIVLAHNTSNTFTLSAGTVLGSNVPIASGTPFVLLYSWTMTSGSFDVSGGTDQGTNLDCWVDEIDLANTTVGAVTFTITDSQGTPINGYKAQSLAANTSLAVQWPGGRFFDGGMQINAAAANSIDVHFRGVRLRRSAVNP